MKWYRGHLFPILIVLLVVALGVAACGATPATEEPTKEVAPPTEEKPEQAAPTETVEEAEEPLKIAWVYGSTVNDYSWNQVWDEGRQVVAEHFGDRVEAIYVDNVPWSEEASQIMEQLIADGADAIVETSGYGDYFYAVSEAHPDVKFLSINTPQHDNEMEYNIGLLRASYLKGVAAGLLSENGKIGYVHAFDAPWSNLWVNAHALGIRSVNPDATLHVTYIGSYFDPTAARQAAVALADFGVDVLLMYPNVEVVMEVAEERGLWTFGRYHPMADFAPNMYVTTVLCDSGGLFIDEVQALLDGTWQPGRYEYMSLGDGVTLDEWGPNVPQEVKDQIEALYDRMVNEGYNPLTGPIYDREGNLVIAEGEAITEIPYTRDGGVEWLVEGVISTD